MKIEINHVWIKWNVTDWITLDARDLKELPEVETEYITKKLSEGYSSGELVAEEWRGWWEVINWEDIAMELYNALKTGDKVAKQKALKRFDDNF